MPLIGLQFSSHKDKVAYVNKIFFFQIFKFVIQYLQNKNNYDDLGGFTFSKSCITIAIKKKYTLTGNFHRFSKVLTRNAMVLLLDLE